MAISISNNGISFSNGTTLSEYSSGLYLDGVFCSLGFQCGRQPGGEVAGFAHVNRLTPSPTGVNLLNCFPFASDTNATCVGGMTCQRAFADAASSFTNGYILGGGYSPSLACIGKFPFAAGGDLFDVASLTNGKYNGTGAQSQTHGFLAGGTHRTPTDPAPGTAVSCIEKFPFAADVNASVSGALTFARRSISGASSQTHGYVHGGTNHTIPAGYNVIDRWSFASDSNATDVGDTVCSPSTGTSGNASCTDGYISGFGAAPDASNIITRYPFASNVNAVDAGRDLAVAKGGLSTGSNSTTHGYVLGGCDPVASAGSNSIQKFNFYNSANAVDAADLSTFGFSISGMQF